jgi:lipoprotein-releasing system ATP-binding protein
MSPVLRLERLERAYTQGNRRIDVLKGASASFSPGEAVALLGPSGAGKSTLLHIAGLLERADSGQVLINGIDCAQLPDNEQTRMRRMEVGFVYQFHHLLPEFSALENVVLPQLILGSSRDKAEARAKDLLGSLGLEERWDHRPAQLSGGEQQRVAIARAVAKRPAVLLCDEPTGALDVHTGVLVLEAIERINRELGTTTAVITHNAVIAGMADRVIHLSDGKIARVEHNAQKVSSHDLTW